MRTLLSLSVLLLTLSVAARAASTDEILKLSQKGMAEDALLAAVENSKTEFDMSATEILKLKDAKVSDRVIMAMLKRKNTGGPVVAQPRVDTPAAPRADAPVRDNREVAGGEGVLNIENLDDRTWSYKYEPDAQTLWIGPATRNGQGNVGAHAGMSLRMRAGTYSIRYGQEPGRQVTVFNNERSQIMLSRVDTEEMEALYVSVYERGEKKNSGKLANLRAARVNAGGYDDNNSSRERVVERVVNSPTVIYRDAPTVIYRETPTYVYPSYPTYYSYPSYYSGCYSQPSYGFGYSSGGHYYRGGSSFNFGFGIRH